MKFWGRFLRIIFRIASINQLRKVKPKLLEAVLAKSISILDDEMAKEISNFIRMSQTVQGGFADRGGKPDLYYSLFGYYIAEAFSVQEVMSLLKRYVSEVVINNELSGVYRYCGAILYVKLVGLDSHTDKLREEIVKELKKSTSKQPEYSGFLGILALFYLKDFSTIKWVVNQYSRSYLRKNNLPCPVESAILVIHGLAGKKVEEFPDKLFKFYRENGGFAALEKAPSEDLLSTGVALFALNFLDVDLRLIKPDCLNFVDSLYDSGGFRSALSDSVSDVEYTFYGLLALGSLV